MFDVTLFLGFEVTPDFAKKLRSVNPNAAALFIDNNSDYLHECLIGERRYLGKFVEAPLKLDQLDPVEQNVQSLIKRLVPEFSTHQYPLILLATTATKAKATAT
jgi:hypothetical protein